jgi:DNA-binding response OmpR family regulator
MIDKEEKRILCVEDGQDSCEMIALLLEQSGLEVKTAGTATEALRIIEKGAFSLIILDTWLAEGSGIELCKQIRSFDSQTPIIFYSGVGYQEDIQQGLSAGAQGYIIKPSIHQLQETIALLVHKQRGRRNKNDQSIQSKTKSAHCNFLRPRIIERRWLL